MNAECAAIMPIIQSNSLSAMGKNSNDSKGNNKCRVWMMKIFG